MYADAQNILIEDATTASRHNPTSEHVSDSWITTELKAAPAEDPAVKATEVNVETFKGAVQLSGFVRDQSAQPTTPWRKSSATPLPARRKAAA